VRQHCDVLIVGSGPVGIAAARRLAERGLRVTVLEAGSAISDPPGSHVRNQARFREDPDAFFGAIAPYLVPVTDPAAPGGLPGAADTALLGGQGILWTNNCPRASDFERWDAMTPDQWEERYAAADQLLQVVSNPTAASRTGHAVRGCLQDVLAPEGRAILGLPLCGRVLPSGAIHFDGPWDVLQAAAPAVRERIAIRPGVRAMRLRHRGGRVIGVDAVGPGNDRAHLQASIVVLAGGALATPRLLHRSGIRPAALGRVHLVSRAAVRSGGPEGRYVPCRPRDRRRAAPVDSTDPASAVAHPGASRHLPAARRRSGRQPHRLLELQAFLPVEFRDENAFVMDGERVRFDFAFSKRDRERMSAMETDVRHLAERLGPWRRGCEPIWLPHGTGHMVGTCRMDRGGWGGVADRRGEVHGFDNLYLCTVGLFPAPVAVNPTLTAVALALNTCDTIGADVGASA
jgi:choline dehydrogenase-like flavoprotein